jgi:hypothetical protein
LLDAVGELVVGAGMVDAQAGAAGAGAGAPQAGGAV